MSKKYVKVIVAHNMQELEDSINALMDADKNWELVTIDSQEDRSKGIQQVLYKAWLQYDRTGIFN